MKNKFEVKDIALAKEGKEKILWAKKDMPVLTSLEVDFKKKRPLKGVRVSGCLHVTAETANLCIALKEAGAKVTLCASNPLSTQDDVAASLAKDFGIDVYAIKGEDSKTYFKHINAVLDARPHIVMDDGADLVSELHKNRVAQIPEILGSTEETTTGVIRLKALAEEGKLLFPVVAVNESKTKHMFDNRYGTGQSTLDGIIRATNKLVASSVFVVAGYGWCGKGLASRARGMGARVIVTEIDAVKALEAVMDGFEVAPMIEAVKSADFICTVTGNKHVLREEHFKKMKDGCIISNSGHFDIEIDLVALKKLSKSVKKVRPSTEEYLLSDGRKVFVVAEGRLVNLGAAEGHPSSVMDMSFANQALGVIFIKENAKVLAKEVHTLSEEVDNEIAKRKLSALKVKMDILTADQKKYLASWEEGTE
jgi:adenosylhomocysteinase